MKKKKLTDEETFELFWDHWHGISRQFKSDKEAAFKKWKKLTLEEKRMAYRQARPYINYQVNVCGVQYLKKARTYLGDKNFNDEIPVLKVKQNHNVHSETSGIHAGNFFEKKIPHA